MEGIQETAPHTTQPTLQKVCWEIIRKQVKKGEAIENRIIFKPKTLNGRYIKNGSVDVSMSALETRPKDEVKKLIQDKGYDTSNLTF